MKTRKILSSLLALVLIAALLTSSAFAATWYLEDGDITVSADENGQSVKQGGNAAVPDSDTVITQRDSSTATSNTITVSTSGGATADVTIKDINISSDGDAIDVGSSSAKITLEGENKIFSESGSALHVSDGDVTITGSGSLEAEIGSDDDNYNDNAKIGSHKDEDMSGTIHITGSATVTTKSDEEDVFFGSGAGIGSGYEGNMSGSIIIDENANVTAFSKEDGAGIGSGYYGGVSGDITISDSAKVIAGSGWDGAGIGTGDGDSSSDGAMSGTITIDGNAQVTAWSESSGAGIGSGEDGNVSGTITIGGSAQVTAGNDDNGAGIGAGQDGSIASTGRIIIRDNAKVTAIGEDEGTGIGAGESKPMAGLIIIQDNAQVTAVAGDHAAAIGSDDEDDMTGTILILGNARITTGILDDDEVHFDYDSKEIKYTLDEDNIGYIGDGQDSNHKNLEGHYVLGPDVTINGLSGSDAEALKQYINMRLSGDNHDGEPENLTKLDVRTENGQFNVTASGEGTVEKILYNGSKTVPTAPGSYPVTVVLNLGGETVEIEIGTIVVPESEPEPEQEAEVGVYVPLYRVTDMAGKDISYEKELVDGVLTLTVKADDAKLILRSGAPDTLRAQGIEKIVFVTTGAHSAFMTADAAALGSGELVLTHSGAEISAALAGKALDTDELLIKE